MWVIATQPALSANTAILPRFIGTPIADSPAAQFAKSMEVNATGVFVMIRTFGEHMAERGRGSIINVASIQGVIAPDFTLYEGLDWGVAPDYFFHKGGMLQLTRFAASNSRTASA